MAALASSSASTTGITMPTEATVQSVKNYYGEVLKSTKDLKTSVGHMCPVVGVGDLINQ